VTKISVFIESKSGEVLGEVISFKDKISIGSGDDCSICLKNIKLAELENEIYFLNGECWLQVGKDGAPVTFLGKQHRSIKISQSSQFQLRDVVLKVILDSIPEFESEATKIVNETMLENSDKTRIVSQNEPTLEVVLSAPHLSDPEATRVVSDFEKTRIQPAQEIVSELRVVESVVPAQDESTLTKTNLHYGKIHSKFEQPIVSELDFGQVQLYIQELINRFQIKERIFPILGVIFIVIAGFIIATRENTVVSAEIHVNNQEKTEKKLVSSKPSTASSGAVASEAITSQTKDGYLNEMVNLFE
jgi:hypothetical protein